MLVMVFVMIIFGDLAWCDSDAVGDGVGDAQFW